MDQSRVCVIILNWNGWPDTLDCLTSLIEADKKPAALIVVDNGSSDDSVAQIQDWQKKFLSSSSFSFHLVQNRNNLGYAGGNNAGISFALDQGDFDFVWLLNNDTTVRPDSLGSLLQCAADSRASIFGSTVVYADRQDIVQCAGGCSYQPLTSIFRPFLHGNIDRAISFKGEPQLDYIFGASFFVRSEVFAQCGLLNEQYFLFYEEIDFCKQAKMAGFNLMWCRESIVVHKGSRSIGASDSKDKTRRSFAAYHENLSTLLFTKKFYPSLLPFVMLFRFCGKCVKNGLQGEWYLLKALMQSYYDFCRSRNSRDDLLLPKKVQGRH